MATIAEYIWVDGTAPTALVRSKTKIFPKDIENITLESFPTWAFDGSSTAQAEGANSDCILKPVNFVPDPVHHTGTPTGRA